MSSWNVEKNEIYACSKLFQLYQFSIIKILLATEIESGVETFLSDFKAKVTIRY